jgi:hypothetical protein
MSCREIIQRQLLTLAMQGEPRALFKVHEIEEDIVTARWKSQIRLLQEILKLERSLRENPESVSEGKLEALKSARRELEDFDKLD